MCILADSDTQTSNPSDPTSETGYEQAEDASQQSIELGDTQEHGITREIEESPQHSVELGSTQEHETMTHDEGFSQQSVELASTQEHGTTLEDEESSQQPIELASTQEHGTTLEDEESSQQSIELGSMQEQGLTAENEEVDGGTRDDVRDEDPRYAGQISNPAGLSYAVTGRLIVGSSVNMQLAKDQYIHVIVEKDRVGSDRDSKQAGKSKGFTLPEFNDRLTLM